MKGVGSCLACMEFMFDEEADFKYRNRWSADQG